jgi:hypothetical protein
VVTSGRSKSLANGVYVLELGNVGELQEAMDRDKLDFRATDVRQQSYLLFLLEIPSTWSYPIVVGGNRTFGR